MDKDFESKNNTEIDENLDEDDVEYVDDDSILDEYEKSQIDYDEDIAAEIKRIKRKRAKKIVKKVKGE